MNDLLVFNDDHAGVAPGDPARNAQAVARILEGTPRAADDPRAFLDLPNDEHVRTQVDDAIRAIKTDELKHVVVIGIGGSSLGMRALLPVIPPGGPRVHVIETVSGYEAVQFAETVVRDSARPEEVAVVVASKSGTTTETAANAGFVIEKLEHHLGPISARVVVITDESSALAAYGAEHGYRVVTMPHAVGGRYSVFSPVGLLPFALAGGSVDALLASAQATHKTFLDEREASVAARMGAYLAAYAEGGYRTHNLFVFEPLLEDLGKWWRQLVGESLGKSALRSGAPAHTSILPIVSVGSTDLHSVGQLYLSGHPNIATTFLSVGEPDVRVPDVGIAPALVPGVGGASYEKILGAIREGVMQAYRARNLPQLSMSLKDRSPEALGAFMQTQMIAVAVAGEILDINVFDQPNVEEYKRVTRTILAG